MSKIGFIRETDRIYRLKVPFEDLYTSVFLIKTEQGNALVDCATYASDVDEYILPALGSFGLRLADITYLILTHGHGDHAGGRSRILEKAPTLKTVDGIMPLGIKGITVYALKGHTLGCIGVLDEASGTLIAGDGVQGDGVGKYRRSVADEEEYLKTLDRIEKDGRVENILFSHAYEPWKKDGVFGREAVKKAIRYCKEGVKNESDRN